MPLTLDYALIQNPPAFVEVLEDLNIDFYSRIFPESFRLRDAEGDSEAVGLRYYGGFYRSVSAYIEIDTLGNSAIHFLTSSGGSHYSLDLFSSNDVDSVMLSEHTIEGVIIEGGEHSYKKRERRYFLDYASDTGIVYTEFEELDKGTIKNCTADTVRFQPDQKSRSILRSLRTSIEAKTNQDIEQNRLRMLSRLPGFMGRRNR